MNTDTYKLSDSVPSVIVRKKKERKIKSKPETFEKINKKWKTRKLNELNNNLEKAKEDLEATIANVEVPNENVEKKIDEMSTLISRIESKIEYIKTGEMQSARKIMSRAIKLKNNMINNMIDNCLLIQKENMEKENLEKEQLERQVIDNVERIVKSKESVLENSVGSEAEQNIETDENKSMSYDNIEKEINNELEKTFANTLEENTKEVQQESEPVQEETESEFENEHLIKTEESYKEQNENDVENDSEYEMYDNSNFEENNEIYTDDDDESEEIEYTETYFPGALEEFGIYFNKDGTYSIPGNKFEKFYFDYSKIKKLIDYNDELEKEIQNSEEMQYTPTMEDYSRIDNEIDRVRSIDDIKQIKAQIEELKEAQRIAKNQTAAAKKSKQRLEMEKQQAVEELLKYSEELQAGVIETEESLATIEADNTALENDIEEIRNIMGRTK